MLITNEAGFYLRRGPTKVSARNHAVLYVYYITCESNQAA